MNLEAIGSLARGMLDLFEGELRDVRFGDLDRDALARQAEEVRDRAREVEAARAVLDEAQASLDAARTELGQLAERTLAYARIYAVDRPELAGRLDGLVPSPEARPRRANKRRKSSAELPFEEEAEGVSSEPHPRERRVDKRMVEASPSRE